MSILKKQEPKSIFAAVNLSELRAEGLKHQNSKSAIYRKYTVLIEELENALPLAYSYEKFIIQAQIRKLKKMRDEHSVGSIFSIPLAHSKEKEKALRKENGKYYE